MEIFDSFETNTDKPTIDLSDFKFTSNDHMRYQNGKEVSGRHNFNCWRGIQVQNNTTGGQGYTVTMYNIEDNHHCWGSSLQMAPKQMMMIEQNNSIIKLRGYGYNQMGGSFADYGLTLHLNNSVVETVTLHMLDRNVDIIYFSADNCKTEQDQRSSKIQVIPEPSADIFEIMEKHALISQCQSLTALNSLHDYVYNQQGKYCHPNICYDFGVALLIKNNESNAKKALINGAYYGIQFPCSLYNEAYIDSIGQCFSLLMTQFQIGDNVKAIKATALGYIYLSRCIELYPREAHDSYKTRAQLFKNHQSPMVLQRLIIEIYGFPVLLEPYIISDFYFASQAIDSPFQSLLQSASQIHQDLEDITVGSKDADEYSLSEMVELGKKRHWELFKTLEKKYINGEFNLTEEELKNAIQ